MTVVAGGLVAGGAAAVEADAGGTEGDDLRRSFDELDAVLDAWFMADGVPALRDAARPRALALDAANGPAGAALPAMAAVRVTAA